MRADRRAVLIAGPTASGKSNLALAVAAQTGGTIVNCDSMQVYADLNVLTARPPSDDLTAAPHRLYGHVDGSIPYSAGHYVRDVTALIDELARAETMPIFVGGTGLYFSALTHGLSPIPEIPEAIRRRWRTFRELEGTPALHAELLRRDPAMAERLSPTDPQRITRALEVIDATGRSLADWQTKPGVPLLAGWDLTKVVVSRPRPELYERSDARFVSMIAAGALGEVERLVARTLSPDLPVLRALGVSAIAAHLAGDTSLDDAIALGQQQTRRYIKRQLTWSNAKMQTWKHVDVSNNYQNDVVASLL
ncbi:MAG: tRNA (adenosine(37)-N6)-dimethylallyltransferase MiaA [Pseudomonadota bacterium]